MNKQNEPLIKVMNTTLFSFHMLQPSDRKPLKIHKNIL